MRLIPAEEARCPSCNGDGEFVRVEDDELEPVVCPLCRGTGINPRIGEEV
jgi:DnaJ-class molecular chaperone